MSVRHETQLEFVLDEAHELPVDLVGVDLKEAVIEKCRAAYGAGDGISEDDFILAEASVNDVREQLSEVLALLTLDEKSVRCLRRRIAAAEDALTDFLTDIKNNR